MFLGLRDTSDFFLLPFRARAVTVAQGLVFSFFSHNFFLLVRPNWKSLADFPFQDPFRLLILAIWPSSLFQLFGCPPFLSFFPNSWNLLLLGWKFSSSHFYLLFFLIFGSLWYSSFVHECLLYTFWFLIAWLGARDPVVLLSCCDLIWVVLCAPGILGLWHSLGSQPGSPYWASFGLLTLADWVFLLLYGILKPFSFMGLWTPILWTFSSFSFFFFPFFITW